MRGKALLAETTMSERDLFIEALRITDPAEQSAWLDRACGTDVALRQRIGVLLRALDQAGSLLEHPVLAPQATVGEQPQDHGAAEGPSSAAAGEEPVLEGLGTEQPGLLLAGRYKLLEQIG